jgi:hypothetical protein
MKMKVFLRDRETGRYYVTPNVWCENASGAHDFDVVESAVQVARAERLEGIEVVLRYDCPPGDLVLPLSRKA